MTDRIDEFCELQQLHADAGRLLEEINARWRLLAEIGDRIDDAETCIVARMAADRAGFPLPDDRELRLALFDADALETPVNASRVARVLWHGEHGHGDLVRLGQRLGMLASVGLVVRHGSRAPYRWSLPARTSGV